MVKQFLRASGVMPEPESFTDNDSQVLGCAISLHRMELSSSRFYSELVLRNPCVYLSHSSSGIVSRN